MCYIPGTQPACFRFVATGCFSRHCPFLPMCQKRGTSNMDSVFLWVSLFNRLYGGWPQIKYTNLFHSGSRRVSLVSASKTISKGNWPEQLSTLDDQNSESVGSLDRIPFHFCRNPCSEVCEHPLNRNHCHFQHNPYQSQAKGMTALTRAPSPSLSLALVKKFGAWYRRKAGLGQTFCKESQLFGGWGGN